MSTLQWLLALHVLSATLFVAGSVAVAVLHAVAVRSGPPSEVARLLGLTRVGVVVVLLGAVGSLAFGLALVRRLSYELTDAWILLSLALFGVGIVLGGIGGRAARHTRYLAERLSRESDEPSVELRRALRDPIVFALNYGGALAVLAVLALMVWKPG